MKITDILIESNDLQIKTLSEQEANIVVGGSDPVADAMSSLVNNNGIFEEMISAIQGQTTVNATGVPGPGGEPDPSDYLP